MTNIPLARHYFRPSEAVLVRTDEFSVSTFCYETGIEALRVTNSAGEIVVLPFFGLQVRDAHFFGRRLTMRSPIAQPQRGLSLRQDFSSFLMHRGITPHAEELPKASCETAVVVIDEDEYGFFVGVTGTIESASAFGPHFLATPELRMYRRSGALRLLFSIRNLSRTFLEYAYLCQVCFRPVEESTLLYAVTGDSNSVPMPAVQKSTTPPHSVEVSAAACDQEGFTYAMQLLPTGDGNFLAYRPRELECANRWILRSLDLDCLGLLMPGTTLLEGEYGLDLGVSRQTLDPGQTFQCELFAGALSAPAARQYRQHLEATRSGSDGSINPVALDAESY